MKKKRYYIEDKLIYEATDPDILKFKETILLNNQHLWIPNDNQQLTPVNEDEWFSFQKFQDDTKVFTGTNSFEQSFKPHYYKSIKAELVLTWTQKYHLKRWFDSSTLMYNATIDYIKTKTKLIQAHMSIINETVYSLVTNEVVLDSLEKNIKFFSEFYVVGVKHKNLKIRKEIKSFRDQIKPIKLKVDKIKKKVLEHKDAFKFAKSLFTKLQIKHYVSRKGVAKVRKIPLYDEVCSNFNVDSLKDIKVENITFDKIYDFVAGYVESGLPEIIKCFRSIKAITDDKFLTYTNLLLELQIIVNNVQDFCSKHNIEKPQPFVNYTDQIDRVYNFRKIKLKITANFIEVRARLKKKKKYFVANCIPVMNAHNLKNQKHGIYVHIMDQSIKIACSNFKSIMTNYMKGHIKTFRLRKIKEGKNNKILKIEQSFLKDGGICKSALGKMGIRCQGNLCKEFNVDQETILSENGKVKCGCNKGAIYTDLTFLENNRSDITMHYNLSKNSFILLIPKKIVPVKIENRKKILSIDPGVRTFLTCLSDNEMLKICEKKILLKKNKLFKKILELRNLREIKNKSHREYKILKKESRIRNLVKEMHWKTINYLCNNYDTILMGNMSTKAVLSNKSKSFTDDVSKDYLQRLSLFKFRERLKERCATRKVNYLKVDETLTSKACSVCGKINWNLKNEKVYECINVDCLKKLDRDVNGCRNIYVRSLM